MLVLAVDTSAKSCSVAVIEKEKILGEMISDIDQTHSKHLMEIIHQVLLLSGLNLSDIDGFATTKGPGSFTGLRIGISSIKGIVLATRKPFAGISCLDALAFQVPVHDCLICPIIDARKGNVYFSRYIYQNGYFEKVMDEQVNQPKQALSNIESKCIFTGDGVFNYSKIIIDEIGDFANFTPNFSNKIRASSVAFLALERFRKNDFDDIMTFVPNYIRNSDAEMVKK